MKRAILTVDDSPSEYTTDLIDFLSNYSIPGILFCRGDRMEKYGSDSLRYALDKGFRIAHHSHCHRPAGEMGFEAWKEDFLIMQDRLMALYDQSGIEWTDKLFRFPYVDRGNGDRIERRFPALATGARLDPDPSVDRLQIFLHDQGYSQDFGSVHHPLYENPVVRDARDCFFTYSSCDWMLTPRHLGKHAHNTVEDLKHAMDTDPWLTQDSLDHIVLFHDEGPIHGVVTDLITHMLTRNFHFTERF